uniref:Secreted protein n=1 Tax=Globodera pallida TaxID=36090 RepID=A0A183BXA8_GLOPA
MKRVFLLQLFELSALIAYSYGGTACTFKNYYEDWDDVSEEIINVLCGDQFPPHCYSAQCKATVRGRWSRIARAGCRHELSERICAENVEQSLAEEEGGIWSCNCHILAGKISPNIASTKSSIGPIPLDAATTTLPYFEFREPIDFDDGRGFGIDLAVAVPTLLEAFNWLEPGGGTVGVAKNATITYLEC